MGKKIDKSSSNKIRSGGIQKTAGKKSPSNKKRSKGIEKATREKNIQKISTIHDSEYVYFIHEREFLLAKKPIYKLGKTTQWNCRRLQDYPKDSALILVWRVPNCHETERALIVEFDSLYKKRSDIGAEYYEGDVNKMKSTFLRVVRTYPEAELNPGWFRWILGGLCGGIKWVVRKT